ncbi:MAG TPA: hypothetical protein PLT45_07570 [Smithella sp.]|nr:hypothetical protein [Smithella sp.]
MGVALPAKTILLLKEDQGKSYIVDVMAEQWAASGHRVLCHAGTRHPPAADIVFLHVNKTVVPPAYADCVLKYPAAINGKALNISRPLYSTARLEKGDSYEGPVIVKTVNNYGGIPERRSVSFMLPLINRLIRRDASRAWRQVATSWRRVDSLNPLEYPVFDSMHKVPPDVWENKHLMVEKFLPEKEGDVFFVRYWQFFGDKNMTGRYGAKHPIVKFHRRVTEVRPVEIPEELADWRKKLHLDYGRFDYVMHEGRPVVLDANKTPGFGARSQLSASERREKFADFSAGIEFYLRDKQ